VTTHALTIAGGKIAGKRGERKGGSYRDFLVLKLISAKGPNQLIGSLCQYAAITYRATSFGPVSIPVQLYTATQDQRIAFNLLHVKCASRIQNRYQCPVCNVVVERADRIRGYELAKNQYVQLTEAELESLETKSSNNIELKEFIPLLKIDPVYVESAYYLGAGEGGEKLYRLLADALTKSNREAIAQFVTRGKEQLVLIRPYENGLIMHSLYYANEVRNFEEIAKAENVKLSDAEIDLGADLIENMSDEFNPEKYRDEYRERVQTMLDEKSKGQEITIAPPAAPKQGQIIDLMQALKQSIEKAKRKPKAVAAQRKRKTAS
jgi:DNA end-binding protein Ku